MKALSLKQPWASLLAGGEKRIETRSWHTRERGRIAIHASKVFDSIDVLNCHTPVFSRALITLGFNTPTDLPLGVIIGTGRLIECQPAIEIAKTLSDKELEFGNYGMGRWAWLFVDLVQFKVPVPCRGMQGLWTIPDHVFPLVDMNEGIAR